MAKKTKTTPTSSLGDGYDTPYPSGPVDAYAEAVINGTIIAGPHVRNAARRHRDDRLNGPARGVHWHPESAEKVFKFFKLVLRLNGGQFEGRDFILHPSQQFIVGSLFGWKRVESDGAMLRRFRRAYIEQGKGNGKALALDTPIPTPSGWTTMGDVRIGDYVIDESGRPTKVVAATDIMFDRECYEVVFDDGERIVADADHLWLTEKRKDKIGMGVSSTNGVKRSDLGKWRNGVRTTKEIAETLRYPNGSHLSANHSVKLSAPLDLAAAALPIEPFTLGVWLGDGDSDCARFTCADNDNETVENLIAAGCSVGKRAGQVGTNGRYRIGSVGLRGIGGGESLNARLRLAGLLGNKHIPSAYLRASFTQRLALLQGLMDTDGYINPINGQCEFTSTNERLANGFRELAHTLGVKTGFHVGVATINGRAISAKYRVTFNPPADLPVFRLTRKLAHQAPRHNRRRLSADRRIVECRKVDSVPVRCIQVDASSSLFLAGRNMVPTHNSPLAAGIGHYGMIADGEAAAEIYAAAANKDQAFVLFRDAVAMYEQSPRLKATVTPSGGNPVWNLAYLKKRSFFRPISREGAHSGPRPYFALCDEIHEHPDGKVIEMLERGFKFRRQPLLFMITNSGSDRNSICWDEHQHAVKVAAGTATPDEAFTYVGEVIDDTTFSYVCSLDVGDDPFTDPTCWQKANPLFGVTLKHDYLAGVVEQAKNIPSKRNGILRLHFCEWTESDTNWIPRPMLDKVMADFDPYTLHRGKRISAAGLDLSGAKDLTAAAFVVETGTTRITRDDGTEADMPTYDAWIEAWTPRDTMDERSKVDHVPYRRWTETFYPGTQWPYLHAPEGQRVRYDHVAALFAKLNAEYGIDVLAFDNYAFDKFEQELDEYGVDIQTVSHPQGGKKRAKPSPDKVEKAKANDEPTPLGLWMPGSVGALETLILEERIRIRKSPLALTALMGVAIETDPLMGNQWFSKKKATVRIDPAVALAMAIGAAVDGAPVPTQSVYRTRGFVEI